MLYLLSDAMHFRGVSSIVFEGLLGNDPAPVKICIHPMDGNAIHLDSVGHSLFYGMCTAALYSRLAGVYLPGKYCLLQECEVSFVKPVFAGEALTVTGTVKEVDERFSRIKLRADIRNAAGEKVSRATLLCGFTKDS